MMYHITWTMDVDADSPREAAEKAWQFMRNEDSTANVFDVQAQGERTVATVDLSEPVLLNCEQSFQEGWGIFLGGYGYLIGRDDEQALLPTDEDAWRLILQRASYGSALHMRALAFIAETAPEESARIRIFAETQS